MRGVIGWAAVCLVLAAGPTVRGDDSTRGDKPPRNIVDVKEDDPRMNAAIAKARKSVDDFIKALKDPARGQTSFAVKVPIPGEGRVEHFWVNDVRYDGKQFTGKINNDPEYVKDVKLGDTVTVGRDKISDWMYVDRGVLVGGQTIRAIRAAMSDADRRELDKRLPFKIK